MSTNIAKIAKRIHAVQDWREVKPYELGGMLEISLEEYSNLEMAAREANEQLLSLLLWIDGWEPNFTNDDGWPSDERRAKNARTKLAALLDGDE